MSKAAKMGFAATIALMIITIAFMTVPFNFQPPNKLRIVLDHTLQVYIAPPCFDQVEGVTNNLSETTWERAKVRGYQPESSCTSDLLVPERTTFYKKLWEKAGYMPSPWDW